jgi:hypothetical protein
MIRTSTAMSLLVWLFGSSAFPGAVNPAVLYLGFYPGAQEDLAVGLDGQGPVAVELDFIGPGRALGQRRYTLEKHGRDEAGFGLVALHDGSLRAAKSPMLAA